MTQIKDSKTKTKNFEQDFKILENILYNCVKYNGVVIGQANSLKKLRQDTINRGHLISTGCLLNIEEITWVLIPGGRLKNAGHLIESLRHVKRIKVSSLKNY